MSGNNVVWQAVTIDKTARAAQKRQRPFVLWFTGISGAGKSTIANLVDERLFEEGRHAFVLDGDNMRHRLNRDLGFSDADRSENVRRASEVARLMVDAGLIVLVTFISPFREVRLAARRLFGEGEFVEIHVDTPIDVAQSRDPKGLYRQARSGAIKQFTGIDSRYEAPDHPEICVDTTRLTAEESADAVIDYLRRGAMI